MDKPAILCVDDEADNVDALERLFRRKYRVHKATGGPEALEIIKKNDLALIITDQRMPKMTGVELLQKSMKHQADCIRILLTGYTDIDSVVGAINTGEIYRYLTKPWDPVDLVNTVDKAVEKFQLRHELKLKNEQLELALEDLKGLDQAKNHFMILINHELKTPLTVLLSFLDLLKETPLDEDQLKYISRMEKSSKRLNQIIVDVLELMAAETGTMKTQIRKTSAKKVLLGISEDLVTRAANKGQELEISAEDTPLKADQKIIQSVIHRVLENAIKFGDKKSKISIQATPLEGSGVEFSVENKGKSLSTKMIDKILKPFSLDEDIMQHSEGMGIGLSLCQALLKTHGSQLKIETPRGRVRVAFELT